MGLGVSHQCACLPEAAGEFDFNQLDACATSTQTGITPTYTTFSETPAGAFCEDTLDTHRMSCQKTTQAGELILSGLRANRLSASLEQPDLEDLVQHFNYYCFNQNEYVVREGEVGSHVFISDTAGLEVMLNGCFVAEVPPGQMFGELALLDKCPRSVVSVMAGSPGVGVWGMSAQVFREAVLKVMTGRLKDTRSFLDTIPLFKELSVRQRDDVCDVAKLHIVEADESLQLRDSEPGRDHQLMYLVKTGEFCVTSQDAAVLKSGDVLGDRTLLYGEPFNLEVTAVTKSELLFINLVHLRNILGDVLHPVRLQRHDCLQSLRGNSSFASLDLNQQVVALNNLEFQELQPQVKTLAPPLFVIVDGSAKVGDTQLTKGMSFGDFPEMSSEGTTPSCVSEAGESTPMSPKSLPSLVAGPQGVRLAAMTWRRVSLTLEEMGVDPDEIGWKDEEHRRDRMVSEISKISVFRHLPSYQIETLVCGISRQRFQAGDRIITEGDEECTHFYLLMNGEVNIKVGEDVIRTLTKYAYFGERALLFNEPRVASIEVASEHAEIWGIGIDVFKQVVQEKSRTEEQLLHRIRLHDHDIVLRDLEPRDILGTGTFGVVTLVLHKKTGFMYALKQVKKKNHEAMADVRREVEILRETDHPLIMHLVKTFETQKSFYMLTEYCGGGELHAAIRTIDVALSRPQAIFYIGSLVLMLETLAERCIVYRDLKPENLMLDDKGYLKLIDFGTAKKLDPSCPRTTTRTGTPHYTAPEVFHELGYGMEVDIWSMGVILFELMCGELPFGNDLEDSPEIFDEVQMCKYVIPVGVESSGKDLIEKLLVFHPASRLGCGPNGFQDLKKHHFFRLDGLMYDANGTSHHNRHKDYFSMLLSRELKAPLQPSLRPVPDNFEVPCDVWPPSPMKPPIKGASGSPTANLG